MNLCLDMSNGGKLKSFLECLLATGNIDENNFIEEIQEIDFSRIFDLNIKKIKIGETESYKITTINRLKLKLAAGVFESISDLKLFAETLQIDSDIKNKVIEVYARLESAFSESGEVLRLDKADEIESMFYLICIFKCLRELNVKNIYVRCVDIGSGVIPKGLQLIFLPRSAVKNMLSKFKTVETQRGYEVISPLLAALISAVAIPVNEKRIYTASSVVYAYCGAQEGSINNLMTCEILKSDASQVGEELFDNMQGGSDESTKQIDEMISKIKDLEAAIEKVKRADVAATDEEASCNIIINQFENENDSQDEPEILTKQDSTLKYMDSKCDNLTNQKVAILNFKVREISPLKIQNMLKEIKQFSAGSAHYHEVIELGYVPSFNVQLYLYRDKLQTALNFLKVNYNIYCIYSQDIEFLD